MAEIGLIKRVKYAGDVHAELLKAGWDLDTATAFVNNIPDADIAPVRHARWVDNHCTACGMMPMGDEMWKNRDFEPPLFERFMDYCPSCGALMDKEE